MRSRAVAFLLTPLLAAVVALAPDARYGSVPSARAATTCDPIQTPPSFRGDVPTAEQVLGFSLGSQEVTSAESNAYVDAVDQTSPVWSQARSPAPGRAARCASRSSESPATSRPRG